MTAIAIALFCLVSWHNYRQLREAQIADAEGDADRALTAVDDHVTHLVDYADSYLRSIRAYYLEHGGGEDLRRYLAATRAADPQNFIGDIAMADGDGHLVFTLSSPNPPPTDISDRAYFKALKDDPTDHLVIDSTTFGRATKQYLFRILRPIWIDGRFAGGFAVAIRPEAIIDLFQQYNLGDHTVISVLQTEQHKFIARLPVGDRSYFEKDYANGDIWARLKESPHGRTHSRSTIDQTERYVTYLKTDNYPLVSFVGMADIDIDASLADTRRNIELQALFFALGAIAICGLILRVIRTETRLRQSNANLVSAQHMGKIGSVEVDLVAMKATWSDELYAIYSRNPAKGPASLDEFLAYVHPDDRAIVAEMREQHASGDVRGPNEYRIVLPDGEVRWIHREVEVVRDASGKPAKLLAAEQDITDRKRADQAKDAFVSTVSHELRTPLTSIRGALTLIASGVTGALPEKTQKLIDVATRNSERLARLVNDLLDVQRIDAGQMVYVIVETPLVKAVADAIEAIRPFALDRDVKIEFVPRVENAIVMADAERIGQVMDNLLSNAIKFSKPGGMITVAIDRRPPWLRITVEDRGEGIPQEFRERIFQRFSQAKSGNTRRSGGSGLGLSIVKAIVAYHHGQVSFDSQVGVGTRFYVDLPEAARTRSAPAVRETQQDAAS